MDIVSRGEVEDQAGGEAAFQMDVVFAFGQALEEGVPVGFMGSVGLAHFVDVGRSVRSERYP